MRKILVVGGYGAVGSHISALLSNDERVIPVVAGRNEKKAKALAQKLDCDWKTIDLENPKSVEEGLKGIHIVISCYVPSANFNTLLAQKAAESGIHYMDLAAFEDYNKRVISLGNTAKQNNSTLITALGLYPGIPAIILAGMKDHFDQIDSADIYFVSGGKMEGLSPLSLQGVAHMMSVPPRQWNGKEWILAKPGSTKEYLSFPFDKPVSCFPFLITYDLTQVPELVPCSKINMWSGNETLFQGMVFFLGLKLGFAKTVKRAGKFVKVLRAIGKKQHEEYSLKIVVKGTKDSVNHKRIIEIAGAEEFLTAIVPVIVCEQLVHGDINQPGAFIGPQILNTKKFKDSLKAHDIHYKETIS